jgi:hypothetical protein
MFLQKHMRTLVVGVFFGSLALFSCDQKNPTESASDISGTGKAVVRLPDLSSSSLGKLSAGVDTNALTLLVVAPGMDTIKYSWPVTNLKGQTVVIDGIPAGSNRLFEGFLTNKTGVLTHTGKVSVTIIAGQEVPVNLKLSGTGSADVCIEIEGITSSCGQVDSIEIHNCLYVSALNGKTNGTLKLYVTGGVPAGTLTLTNAKGDSSEFYEIDSKSAIKIVDSVSYKYCSTVAFERNTRIGHALYLVINKSSEVVYGLLSKDTTLMTNIIAKFYSVKCTTTPVDTIAVSSCIASHISSESITGQMNMSIYGKSSVSGSIYLVRNGSKSVCYFSKLIRLIDSANITCIRTTLVGDSSKSQYCLDMYLEKGTQNWYAILYKDSTLTSVISQIEGVDCATPTDSIVVASCIEGSTPTDSLTGKISVFIKGKNASGYIYLQKTKDNVTLGNYTINRVIQISDSTDSSVKYMHAIVLNDLTKTSHYVYMVINKNSEVTDGRLWEDTVMNGNTIAKFTTGKCPTAAIDTTYDYSFVGTGYNDSISFTAKMSIKVANGKATGNFYFINCPVLKDSSISVSGNYESSSGSLAYLYLSSTDTTGCYYRINLKVTNGTCYGDLYQEGICGEKIIAYLTSKTGTY